MSEQPGSSFSWRSTAREGRVREVVTPEGVPLRFTVAPAWDRISSFALDGVLIAVVGALLWFGLLLLNGLDDLSGWGTALYLLALFLLRNFYFTLFELRWRGATPGKRRHGIRVMDAHGGVLTSEAVIVRNLTREVEVFIPLLVLLQPEAVGLAGGWTYVVTGTWLAIFALFPLFNRDRLRIGDLVGGTIVVRSPKAPLLPALDASRRGRDEIAFTARQLGLYGVYELQVLEDVLRRSSSDRSALEAVAEKIQRKIGWEGSASVPPKRFLRAFYEAQRAHLEKQLLLGRARERKVEGRLAPNEEGPRSDARRKGEGGAES